MKRRLLNARCLLSSLYDITFNIYLITQNNKDKIQGTINVRITIMIDEINHVFFCMYDIFFVNKSFIINIKAYIMRLLIPYLVKNSILCLKISYSFGVIT